MCISDLMDEEFADQCLGMLISFLARTAERNVCAGLCSCMVTVQKSYTGLLEEAHAFAAERFMSQALFHRRAPEYVAGIFRNCYDYSP